MLRGFRWQLILLIGAAILLGAAALFRLQSTPTGPLPPPAPTTASATPPPVAAVPTPLPPPESTPSVVFREGLVGQVQRLNPLFAGLNPTDQDITALIFEGLVRTNDYGEIVPALAEHWLIGQDGLEYVFQLRQDALWQDGVPFSSLDVAATVALLQAPGDALPESLTAFWRTVEVMPLDEYTVRFRLAQPLAAFLDYLRVGLLPAHVFAGLAPEQLAAHPFNLSPIGTGPYQLERLLPGDEGIAEVTLRVAPVHRQRADGASGYALERFVFRLYPDQASALDALRDGEIDALGGVEAGAVVGLEQSGVVATHIGLQPVLGAVLFNWEGERTRAFRDQRVRRALTVGADRISLVQRHLSGRAIPADSPFVPGSWAHAGGLTWPAYDPAAAIALLETIDLAQFAPEPTATPESEEADQTTEEAATPTPEPPSGFAFTLLSSDDPALAALAADLAAQWSLLGIQVGTEAVPAAELQARLESGQFDAALVELSLAGSADPDPYPFWHQGQYGPGQNYGGVNDRRSSELLENARRDPNGLHRVQYYAEFQQAFVDRSLALLLYYPVYQYAVTAHLEGLHLGYLSTPADRFRDLQAWTLRP